MQAQWQPRTYLTVSTLKQVQEHGNNIVRLGTGPLDTSINVSRRRSALRYGHASPRSDFRRDVVGLVVAAATRHSLL